jgi:antitoxin VapB
LKRLGNPDIYGNGLRIYEIAMGILIKRPETEEKIRELANRTGESITDAVDRAVDERLAKLMPRKLSGRVDWERLEALVSKVKANPALNVGKTDDEIIGYDEIGVPR